MKMRIEIVTYFSIYFAVERNIHFTGCNFGATVFYHNVGRNVVFGLSRASFGNSSQGSFDIIWMDSI